MNIYLILRFLLLFSSFNFTCCLNNVLFFASFHFKSIYIYIFSFKILITCNQSIKKKKLSSIINQRNNFLKWKKIVTTRRKNSRYHSPASFEFCNVDVFDEGYTYRSRGKTSILIVQRFAKRRKCRKVFRIRVRKRYLVSEKLRCIAWWFTSGRERDVLFFLERVCKSHRNRSDPAFLWNTGTVARG